jgi:predicted ATPase/class 3 adenylate cyclase
VTDRPVGTVTLLFTDIEGSTRLLQQLGDSYRSLLSDHHRLVRSALAQHAGTEVKTEGDAFFVVFPSAIDAVQAAVAIQRDLVTHAWPGGVTVAVRMGIHTGEVALAGDEYVGLDVHRAARISAAAHGGQALLSETARDLVRSALPPDVRLADLGIHRMKDIDRPEHLWQLVIDGLRSEFPPIRSRSARFQALPSELTTFIGRGQEVARAAELLLYTRLLTLTGPGGTGKTRLSIAIARAVDERFADGLVFVALAALSDPRLVAPTIRATLGQPEESGRPAIDTIVDGLQDAELLLVLDNFEQVLGAAEQVGELLARTSRLRVLVTSRSMLHLTGEQEFAVPPMGVPDPAAVREPADAERSEAVALFVARARSLRPDFRLDRENVAAVVEICTRLDGLPLAIELAASRIKLLPPAAMLRRLQKRLDLLESTTADRTDRQRTLRGAIDWSHDLLGEAERRAFRRLAIFVGGSGLEDAEAIVGAGGGAGLDPLEAISALVDHSLLRQDERAGEPRFAMLETIREYGLERLVEAGEAEVIGRDHAERFLYRAIADAPRFTGAGDALDRTEGDHDNVRAALQWSVENGQAELAMRASGALWRFWHLRGHLREGQRLLEAALACPDGPPISEGRARALYGLGSLRYWQGDYASASEVYAQALSVSRSAGDRASEAEALYAIGYVDAIPGDYQAAREAFRASLDIYADLGDQLGVANSMFGIALADYLGGRYEDARTGLESTLEHFERLDDRFSIGNTHGMLGRTFQYLEAPREARRHSLLFLDLSLESGDQTGVSMALRDLSSLAGHLGRHPEALRLLGASLAIDEALGGKAPPTLVKVRDALEMARKAGVAETEIERSVNAGRALSRDQAIELARVGLPSVEG